MWNKITVNGPMSALGSFKIFYIFDRALIGEGHLLEKGAYWRGAFVREGRSFQHSQK